MGCTKRCLLNVLAMHVMLLLLVAGVFAGAGVWLRTSDEPAPADIIVVLAGAPERAFYAADVYRQGYAPRVFVSRPMKENGQSMLNALGIEMPSSEEIYSQVLMRKGVPAANITAFGTGSLSTVEEAIALREEIRGKQLRILVVTSPFHVRRSKIIFRNILKDHVKELRVLSDPYEPFPTKWWTNQDAARNVMLEGMKLVFFQFGGAFLSRTH